ncbi:MAG: aminotransferase class III-fold pyridoxal phosphate-dependent enzyme [Bacteroidetes bacterium]|nr:aminotransferase class III-fold pyridoxal phosphate-dependent enzyme [Bacteroidota bacterium]MDA1120038.1 aminotransferase class III-fold pyridoxal phosphate-dependent enzyme [Bacteroidota bacterium]
MKRFDVYPLFNIEPVKGEGAYIYDQQGVKYLDFYSGHGVISIGHAHPYYVEMVSQQLSRLPFYSNSIINPLQDQLAKRLGEVSGLMDYQLFLVNSGAEANEAALKIAAGQTGRRKIISLERGFHGRTALAIAASDNPKYHTSMNDLSIIQRIPMNDFEAIEKVLNEEVAAVIIEGIQGVAGIYEPEQEYLKALSRLTKSTGTMLILDEVQSGYGRAGKFYAFEYSGIKPDLITMAKGMGNGFPIGGVAVAPHIAPPANILGSTFGGNHLACSAGIAVVDVIKKESLVENSAKIGSYLINQLREIEQVKEIRGKGLMIGIEFDFPIIEIRNKLLMEHQVFTGNATQPNTIRLLPPLSIGEGEANQFIKALKHVLTAQNEAVYIS